MTLKIEPIARQVADPVGPTHKAASVHALMTAGMLPRSAVSLP